MNKASYSFNLTDLNGFSFNEAVEKMKIKIDAVLEGLVCENGQIIERFSIGKTYAHKAQRADKLDPLDESTFKKKGIQNRWTFHQTKEYGKDGMVVVAVITNDVAKNLGHSDPQICALNIEKDLQQRYQTDNDKRLQHTSYHRGPLEKNGSEGYPLYITYAFRHRDRTDLKKDKSFPGLL